jgi:hypothetical protein
MKRKLSQLLLLVATITFLEACKSGDSSKDNKKDTTNVVKKDTIPKETTSERTITQNKKYNQIARFIAGLPQQESSELKKYEESDAWKRYSKESEAKWKRLKEGKIAKMRAWAEQELKEPNAKGGLLFYPFSGADFLHAQIFFPNADEIVMIGLEPIGTPLDVEKIEKKQTTYFAALDKAGYFLAEFSFFRTNDMAVDLTGKRSIEVDGTIHLIMLYMAQLDNEIINYEKVAINNEGKVVLANEVKDKNKKVVYGNKIYFKRKGDSKIRSLTYFSVNIINMALEKETPEFKTYLQSLRPTATYLKAASYLMYKPEFTIVRNVILKNTQFVLQDDSGMPLSNFSDDSKWQKTFFGVYAGPIGLFSNYYQTDMKNAFKNKDQVKPLPFGIGYQFREGSSNLMLAKKIGEVTDADLESKTKKVVVEEASDAEKKTKKKK